MAPEHEARTRVLYDHENDEPRRRRAVADWGVGEDIFDRMPSRRFTRAERRAEHRFERREPAGSEQSAAPRGAPPTTAAPLAPGESRTIVIARPDRPAPAATVTGRAGEFATASPLATAVEAGADRGREAPDHRGREGADHRGREAADHRGRDGEPAARRTVVISGHPERLPAGRPPRPPRTAVERVGTSPDRIVAYAVALGFLLVLIAVLTTGQ